MSKTLISTAKTLREMVIQQVQAIPEELFDNQPEQFSNTIRWNIGHIIVSHEHFLSLGSLTNAKFPDQYPGLFMPGNKPSDWSSTPPAKEELIQYLSAQSAGISAFSPSELDKEFESPLQMGPLKFETFEEIFNFSTLHETMHFTTISCLLKTIQHDQK